VNFGSRILFIDDLDVARMRLSDVGQRVLRGPVERVRDAVYEQLHRQSWDVVNYRSFSQWATDKVTPNGTKWIVLDPLFDVRRQESRCVRLRTSRGLDLTLAPLRFEQPTCELLRGETLGIIDDAAASGRTITATLAFAAHLGLEVNEVVVCAASGRARDCIVKHSRSLRFLQFLPGDWTVAHMRDGFPFLPFSGRPTGQRIEIGQDRPPIELRAPSSQFPGTPWWALSQNRNVRQALGESRREVYAVLSLELGRPAQFSDLTTLGDDVGIYLEASHDTRPPKSIGQ